MQNRVTNERPPRGRLLDHQGTAANEGGDLGDAMSRQFEAARRSAEKFIAAHPAACLGTAVSIGILLGWWIKRQ